MSLEGVCSRCGYRTNRAVTVCPICEIPLTRQERSWSPSRRGPRIPLPPGVWGEVSGQLEVLVVDLSANGARLEHQGLLRPGHPCQLTLRLGTEAAARQLPARVVWSAVQRMEAQAGLVYHSGLEFRRLGPEVGQALSTYLRSIDPAAAGPLAGAVASPAN